MEISTDHAWPHAIQKVPYARTKAQTAAWYTRLALGEYLQRQQPLHRRREMILPQWRCRQHQLGQGGEGEIDWASSGAAATMLLSWISCWDGASAAPSTVSLLQCSSATPQLGQEQVPRAGVLREASGRTRRSFRMKFICILAAILPTHKRSAWHGLPQEGVKSLSTGIRIRDRAKCG